MYNFTYYDCDNKVSSVLYSFLSVPLPVSSLVVLWFIVGLESRLPLFLGFHLALYPTRVILLFPFSRFWNFSYFWLNSRFQVLASQLLRQEEYCDKKKRKSLEALKRRRPNWRNRSVVRKINGAQVLIN